MSTVVLTAVPLGGVITLSFTTSGSGMVLARAIDTGSGLGAYTPIYTGPPVKIWIDAGDGQPLPLSSGALYSYQLTDANGTLTTPSIQPETTFNIEQEQLLPLLIRLFQAGLTNVPVPAGVSVLSGNQVLQAMPIVGVPPVMPFITVNMDLIQQDKIPIGQNVPQPDPTTGEQTITGLAKRVFRVSVLANNSIDRDFYRDAAIGVFEAMIWTVFAPIGLDVRHRYQAATGQVANDPNGMSPGFYYSDILIEFDGTSNIGIFPTYGFIRTITTTSTLIGDATVQTSVSG